MWQLARVLKRNVVLLSGAEAFTLTLGLDFLSYGHESHDASCSNNLFLEVHAYQRDHAKPNLSSGSTYQSPRMWFEHAHSHLFQCPYTNGSMMEGSMPSQRQLKIQICFPGFAPRILQCLRRRGQIGDVDARDAQVSNRSKGLGNPLLLRV